MEGAHRPPLPPSTRPDRAVSRGTAAAPQGVPPADKLTSTSSGQLQELALTADSTKHASASVCSKCGALIKRNYSFCNSCGQAVSDVAPAKPTEWTRVLSKSKGKTYFFNTRTGECRWSLPGDWIEVMSASQGRPYFFNTFNGVCQWEFPTAGVSDAVHSDEDASGRWSSTPTRGTDPVVAAERQGRAGLIVSAQWPYAVIDGHAAVVDRNFLPPEAPAYSNPPILLGDVVLQVDAEDTVHMTFAALAAKLDGPVNSIVNITLARKTNGASYSVCLLRQGSSHPQLQKLSTHRPSTPRGAPEAASHRPSTPRGAPEVASQRPSTPCGPVYTTLVPDPSGQQLMLVPDGQRPMPAVHSEIAHEPASESAKLRMPLQHSPAEAPTVLDILGPPRGAPVELKLKLGLTYAMAGQEGSAERATFVKGLQHDLASAVGLPPDCFQITALLPGSVIVDTRIIPDPHHIGPEPQEALLSIARQADDPQSALRRGTFTRYVQAVGIPSKSNLEPALSKRPLYILTRDILLTRSARGGVGLRFFQEITPGPCVVLELVPGEPAKSCGSIQPGDHVLAVDGTRVDHRNVEEVSAKMRGVPGSNVTITIGRPRTRSELPVLSQYTILDGELEKSLLANAAEQEKSNARSYKNEQAAQNEQQDVPRSPRLPAMLETAYEQKHSDILTSPHRSTPISAQVNAHVEQTQEQNFSHHHSLSHESGHAKLFCVRNTTSGTGKSYPAGQVVELIKEGDRGWTLICDSNQEMCWLPQQDLAALKAQFFPPAPQALEQARIKPVSAQEQGRKTPVILETNSSESKSVAYDVTVQRGPDGRLGMRIAVAQRSDPAVIAALLPAGAAAKSRLLRTGDMIHAVDGDSVYGLTTQEVGRMLSGMPHTEVVLTISAGKPDNVMPNLGKPENVLRPRIYNISLIRGPKGTVGIRIYYELIELPGALQEGEGSRGGVGVWRILELMPQGAAWDSSMVPGMIVHAIEGQKLDRLDMNEVVSLMDGDPGTVVNFSVSLPPRSPSALVARQSRILSKEELDKIAVRVQGALSRSDDQAMLDMEEDVLDFAGSIFSDRPNLCIAMLQKLAGACMARGSYEHAKRVYEMLAYCAADVEDASTECQAWLDASVANMALGLYHEALESLSLVEIIAKDLGDEDRIGRILAKKGLALIHLEDYSRAARMFELYYVFTQEIGDIKEEGFALSHIAQALHFMDRQAEALVWHIKHLERARSSNDVQMEAIACSNVGVCYGAMNNHQEAAIYHQKHKDMSLQLEDKEGEMIACANLGGTYMILGEQMLALQSYTRQLALSREIKDINSEVETLLRLGCILETQGQYSRAATCLEERLSLARQMHSKPLESETLGLLGKIYLELAQPEYALQYLGAQLRLCEELGEVAQQVVVCSHIGGVQHAQRRYSEAAEMFLRQLELATRLKDARQCAKAYGSLGLLFQVQGQEERALEFHRKHLDIAREIGNAEEEATAQANLDRSRRWQEQNGKQHAYEFVHSHQ